MSAGKFSDSKYELDNGTIVGARVQPETLLAVLEGNTNAAPVGDADVGYPKARVSSSPRSFGITMRQVNLKWTGAVPDGYDPAGTVTIPIMTKANFDAIGSTSTGTYLGSPVKVIGKRGETVR